MVYSLSKKRYIYSRLIAWRGKTYVKQTLSAPTLSIDCELPDPLARSLRLRSNRLNELDRLDAHLWQDERSNAWQRSDADANLGSYQYYLSRCR